MRPVIRYQSQLLFRKSYKPVRILHIRLSTKGVTFRPSRSGIEPREPGKSIRIA